MSFNRLYTKCLLIVFLLFSMPYQAWAAPIRWVLSGVIFSDGGVATGFIDLDLDIVPSRGIATIGDFNINVSGGNENIFPAVTYDIDNTNIIGFLPLGPSRPENPEPFFLFQLADPTRYGRLRQLRISPIFPLDGTLNRVPLLTADVASIGAEECYACGPFREVVGGMFIPEPPVMFLFFVGLTGIVFVKYRRN